MPNQFFSDYLGWFLRRHFDHMNKSRAVSRAANLSRRGDREGASVTITTCVRVLWMRHGYLQVEWLQVACLSHSLSVKFFIGVLAGSCAAWAAPQVSLVVIAEPVLARRSRTIGHSTTGAIVRLAIIFIWVLHRVLAQL